MSTVKHQADISILVTKTWNHVDGGPKVEEKDAFRSLVSSHCQYWLHFLLAPSQEWEPINSVPSSLSVGLVSTVIGKAGSLFHSSNHHCALSLCWSMYLSLSPRPLSIFSIRPSLWLLSLLYTLWLYSWQEESSSPFKMSTDRRDEIITFHPPTHTCTHTQCPPTKWL